MGYTLPEYVKIWTDIISDRWFSGLTATARNVWFTLITIAKLYGGTGTFSVQSWRALGTLTALDGRTACRIVGEMRTAGKILYEELPNGVVTITIPKYKYYQEVKTAKDKPTSDPAVEHSTKPNAHYIREDKIREDKSIYLDSVLLTESEHLKLLERFGKKTTSELIERLNNYLMSSGKKYKSHYHTILGWAAKDGLGQKQPSVGKLPEYKPKPEDEKTPEERERNAKMAQEIIAKIKTRRSTDAAT